MYPGLFQKFISSLILISFFNLTCIGPVHAMQGGSASGASMDTEEDEEGDRRHLLPQTPLQHPLDDASQRHQLESLSLTVPTSFKTTLLDLVVDDTAATEEVKGFVASLPSGIRAELRTFENLQEYVKKLGPTGTTIKWTFSVLNGLGQAAGTGLLFSSTPAMGGMLDAMPESLTSPPNPRLIGYSALAAAATLPDTILGSENMVLAVQRAFEDERLLKYMKKKGATHIILRGLADATGVAIFLVMTVQSFQAAIAGTPGSMVLFGFLGAEICLHVATQSAQIVDGGVVDAMRWVRDKKSHGDVLEAREYFNQMMLDDFRMSLKDRPAAQEKMREIRALRNYVQEALAELAIKREEFETPEAYLTAKHTLEEFGVLAELEALLNFNPSHLHAPPPHEKRWFEKIPFLGRLLGPYLPLYKVPYAVFGAFSAVGSYMIYYGYAWFFGAGDLGMVSATATGFGVPVAVLFTLYFMDQLARATANIANSAMGHNTAFDVDEIDQTHVGSKSRWNRIGRTVIDGCELILAGYKTLFKTASYATGASNLYGCCSSAQIQTQMPGIVAVAASEGASDFNTTGPRLQQAISRYMELKNGSGAQALTDYIARMRAGIADMNNEDVLELKAALDGFHELVQRLIAEHDVRKVGETERDVDTQGSAITLSNGHGAAPHGIDMAVVESSVSPTEIHRSGFSEEVLSVPQSEAAERRARQQESSAMSATEMKLLGLKEPLLQAENARQQMTTSAAEGELGSKVRSMVSSVWSKVTRPAPTVGLVKDV